MPQKNDIVQPNNGMNVVNPGATTTTTTTTTTTAPTKPKVDIVQPNDGTNVINPGTNTQSTTTTTTTNPLPTYTHSGGGGSWEPADTSLVMTGSPGTGAKHHAAATTSLSYSSRVLTPADHLPKKVLFWDISKHGTPTNDSQFEHAIETYINPWDFVAAQGETINKVKYDASRNVYIVPFDPAIAHFIQTDVPIQAHGNGEYDQYRLSPSNKPTDTNLPPTVFGNKLNLRIPQQILGDNTVAREITFRGSSTDITDNIAGGNFIRLVKGTASLENIIVPKHRNFQPYAWANERVRAKFLNGSMNDGDMDVSESYITPEDEFGASADQASPKQTLSPLHPFTRIYPEIAHRAIWTSYNRTKLPIADIEHRKAFRHIFISRPECYICCTKGSGEAGDNRLSQQAFFDEEFHSSYMRYPHVSEMLSPVYICQAPGDDPFANWNYLLTNRVQGLSVAATSLGVRESVTAATSGVQITPGTIITSNNGGTLDLQFRDTKYMDVYEMIRMWMWYIHKRTTGEFFPPFNGYRFQNNWGQMSAGSAFVNGYRVSHPLDRALEYCASLYDIVVDETGTNILYWCKYYGIFPISVSNAMLTNDKNGALASEATITTTFRYQYKLENIYRTLCEFNYNAGMEDALIRDGFEDSGSFISRRCYFGAGGMFTGTPFIVQQKVGKRNPLNPSQRATYQPRLCFRLPKGQSSIDFMNVGLTRNNESADGIY